jgi:branched-chain amino acid transport system permease protein
MTEIGSQSFSHKIAQSKRPVRLAVLFVSLCVAPFFTGVEYYIHVFVTIFVFVIYASTYRFILRTGQLHIGAHGFIGAGAYASVLMVMRLGLPFWVAMPLAGIVGAILAVMIGYPALRVKGVYFAIITWGFAESLRFLYVRVKNPFGGTAGIARIPRPDPIPIPFLGSIDFSGIIPCYFLALILMVMTLWILYRLERSRFGLIYSCIRETDVLAKAVGINIMRYKVLAFAICSGLAAVGASFFAHYSGYVTHRDFVVLLTIYLGMYVIVGGIDNFIGPIVGTAFLVVAGEFFAGYGFYKMTLYAGLMIVITLFFPGGIAGLPKVVTSGIAKFRKQ